MKKIFPVLLTLFIISCGRQTGEKGERIISVSIAPFKYFVEQIAGNDFTINVMVPSGSNPHIYEPFPEQINKLRKSEAYISNGYLGFEMTWLDRFYDTNKKMKRLSVGDNIDPLIQEHGDEGKHVEAADPHYWVSPKCALIISSSVYKFLCEMNPVHKEMYAANYETLVLRIKEMDSQAKDFFINLPQKSFMIFHPNLGYLARDYGLEEISVEYEGKEPPPSRMKFLIDLARKDNIKSIFVQKEYDTKNAKAIADEIGGKVIIIDPLSEDWYTATMNIITNLHNTLSINK